MEYIILIIIGLLIILTLFRLYPYLKDFKVTSSEKAKVQEILIDTAKDILSVASSNKSKDQLVVVVTNITTKKLEKENITNFPRKDIEHMASIIIDKLEEFFPKNNK
jgi:hypothetical protein